MLKEFNVQVSRKDELEQQRPKVNRKELPNSCGIGEQIKFQVGIPREETSKAHTVQCASMATEIKNAFIYSANKVLRCQSLWTRIRAS